MDKDLLDKYNQSFTKLKTLNVFNDIPEYDAKTCDLCLYGISFENMQYQSVPNLDDTDKFVISRISEILCLYLNSNDTTKIYNPRITFSDGRRSLDICDLNQEFVEALYESAENLFQQPIILSRIFDVIWVSKLLKDKRNYTAGEKAYNFYKIVFQTALDAKNYYLAQNILSRVHNLIPHLGKNFPELRNKHFNSLRPLLDIDTSDNNIYFMYTLWQIVLNINWADNNNVYQKIISQIQKVLPTEKNIHWIENCTYLLCKIYHKSKNPDKCQDVLKNLSQKYIEQAENTTHPIAQIHFLSKAIETLRRINKNPYKQKIIELYSKIQELQTQKENYLKTVTAEVDITKEVTDLLKQYQNGSFQECVMGLWLSKRYLPTKENIQHAITSDTLALTDIIPTSFQNHLGQTVSIKNDYREFTHKQMARGIVFGMRIKPLLQLLNERFFYNQNSFGSIVSFNHMIPEGYENIYAKGIYYFFKCQYLEAATILVPLIENSLRHILSIKQPTIYKFDNLEIFANKIDLRDLFDSIMKENILDNNLLWHLRDLMIDDRINIRNYIAHGLFPSDYFYSEEVVMLLFIIFALIFDPLGNEILASIKQNKSNKQSKS